MKIIVGIVVVGIVIILGFYFISTVAPGENNEIDPGVNNDLEPNGELENENEEFNSEITRSGEGSERVVVNLIAGETLEADDTVSGQMPGFWFFEASTDYEVLNSAGTVIGSGIVTADGEWMTTELVPFSESINYTLTTNTTTPVTGVLRINKANASGLDENAGAIEIPVMLLSSN